MLDGFGFSRAFPALYPRIVLMKCSRCRRRCLLGYRTKAGRSRFPLFGWRVFWVKNNLRNYINPGGLCQIFAFVIDIWINLNNPLRLNENSLWIFFLSLFARFKKNFSDLLSIIEKGWTIFEKITGLFDLKNKLFQWIKTTTVLFIENI